MIFRTVGRKHPIPRAEFTGPAAEFWGGIELSRVPFALVAYHGGAVIGWHRYAFSKRHAHFWDAGIWVHPTYRGHGWARAIYAMALQKTGAKIVTVATISTEGRALIASLVRDMPKIAWQVEAEK